MKRTFALVLCSLGIAYAVSACGGSGGESTAAAATPIVDAGASAPTADKLTIVGSGS